MAMSEGPKVTVIGNPEIYPRVLFDSAELPFPVTSLEWEASYGQQYVVIRIPVREATIRPNG